MNEIKKTKSRLSIRQYQEGDEEQILELRGITLSGSRSIPWWQWIYRNGPAGPAICWLAVDCQKIIGHHALLPLHMKIKDQEYKGSLAFDVMTHPDYQRQGVLTEIRAKIFDSAVESDITFSYGSTTPGIFPVYAKTQSFFICEPPLLVKIVSLGKVLTKRFGIPTFIGNVIGYIWVCLTNCISSPRNTDIKIEQISSFDKSIDAFWSKASGIKKIMVIRDMKYLNWRYVEKPEKEYVIFLARKRQETVGYIVLKLEKDTVPRGLIFDLLTLPGDDIAGALVTWAVEYLRGEGAAVISCLMLPDVPYYRTLRKMGFMRRYSHTYFGARLIDQTLSKEFIADPANWYYTLGDCDSR